MSMETMNNKEVKQLRPTEEVKESVSDLSAEAKQEVGQKTQNKLLVQDFLEKNKDLIAKHQDKLGPETLQALKNPENLSQVAKMKLELGYGKEGKNYYNPLHQEAMKEKKSPDTDIGPFTLGAINNMIADKIQSGTIEQKPGMDSYIGTLHPYFFDKLSPGQLDVPAEAQSVLSTMEKIKSNTATPAELTDMQNTLDKLGCYPPLHHGSGDGKPGQFTQDALQTFVLKYDKK